MIYEKYTIESDIIVKNRKHIQHLVGWNGNEGSIIATYSLKTKRLLIKNANEHIPNSQALKEFIDFCEKI